MRERWGAAPTPSSISSPSGESPAVDDTHHQTRPFNLRSAALNQVLHQPPRAPTSVQPAVVDNDLLKESLAE